MADTGWLLPQTTGTETKTDKGGFAYSWVNTDNIKVEDDVCSNHNWKGPVSEYPNIVGCNWNLSESIPTGATLNGIEVKLRGKAVGTTESIADYSIYLGTWSSPTFTPSGNNLKVSGVWLDTFEERTYGGPANMWGTSFGRVDVILSQFAIGYASYIPINETSRDLYLDYIKLKVYYTEAVSRRVFIINC